jgi:hypothetical protein
MTESSPDQLDRVETANELAQALRAAGRTREATAIMYSIIAELSTTGFLGTSILPNAVSFLTSALFELGEIAAVDSVVGDVMRRQAERGENSSSLLHFLYGLAKLRKGDLDSADTWLGRSVRDTTEGTELSSYLPPALTQLRLEQGRLADARRSFNELPSGTATRRVNRAWFAAWLRYAAGDARGAMTMLEDSARVLRGDGPRPRPQLAAPLTMAAEWRLTSGNARLAYSLALVAVEAAAIDSLARTRSAWLGRAELTRARVFLALRDSTSAGAAANRAAVAMTNGLGSSNGRARAARALRDSLSR